jgi:hypothetical protein
VAAELMANTELMRQIRDDYDLRRQQLRVDAMIVAAAIVHRADVLVSGDPHHKKLAQGRIRVIAVPDIPEATQPGELFPDQS